MNTATLPQVRYRLLYDLDQMRPGCALLQAVGDGDRDLLMELFPSSTWLVHPTDGMRLYTGTREEWEAVAAVSEEGP